MPNTKKKTTDNALATFIRSAGAKWLAVPAVAGVAAWTIIAGSATTCKVDVSTSPTEFCKGGKPGPANVEVDIDTTMINRDPALAAGVERAAMQAVEMPIRYGGTFRISLFERSAARAEILDEKQVPTLTTLPLAKRGGLQNDLRREVKSKLATLSAPDGQPSGFAAGSDVLGAYTQAPTGPLSPGMPRVRVVLTDGRVQVPGWALVGTLRRHGEAEALKELREHLPQARGPKPDGLVIAGIGGTGGLISAEDPRLTDQLTVITERLCKEIARTCHVTSVL